MPYFPKDEETKNGFRIVIVVVVTVALSSNILPSPNKPGLCIQDLTVTMPFLLYVGPFVWPTGSELLISANNLVLSPKRTLPSALTLVSAPATTMMKKRGSCSGSGKKKCSP